MFIANSKYFDVTRYTRTKFQVATHDMCLVSVKTVVVICFSDVHHTREQPADVKTSSFRWLLGQGKVAHEIVGYVVAQEKNDFIPWTLEQS